MPAALQPRNLLESVKPGLAGELIEELASRPALRIERIVSQGHVSPEGFWYDQDEDEWVLVLAGAAKLLFDDRDEPIELGPGDFLEIPAHARHRVAWTDPVRTTVWLAVYLTPDRNTRPEETG
jgi:cupin 2 domain-containing protein